MITTPDGVAIYSQEEINAKYQEGMEDGRNYTVRSMNLKTREAIIEVMREEADNTMTNEDATELANKLLSRLDLDTVDTLVRKFTVTISVFGNEIITLEDVEAEDENAACNIIESEISISDISASFTISTNEASEDGSFNGWDFDLEDVIRDNMEVTAEAQD